MPNSRWPCRFAAASCPAKTQSGNSANASMNKTSAVISAMKPGPPTRSG